TLVRPRVGSVHIVQVGEGHFLLPHQPGLVVGNAPVTVVHEARTRRRATLQGIVHRRNDLLDAHLAVTVEVAETLSAANRWRDTQQRPREYHQTSSLFHVFASDGMCGKSITEFWKHEHAALDPAPPLALPGDLLSLKV